MADLEMGTAKERTQGRNSKKPVDRGFTCTQEAKPS